MPLWFSYTKNNTIYAEVVEAFALLWRRVWEVSMRFFERVSDSSAEFLVRPLVEPESATLAELINLILGTDLGLSVLQHLGGQQDASLYTRLRTFLKSSTSGDILGLTPKRMAKLQAAVELGKRLYCTSLQQGEVVDGPEKASQVLQSAIGFESVEKFAVLILDIKHRLLSREIISSGSASETFACPKDIFRAVIMANGCRCIIAHNHPSGSVEPSGEDIELTRQILRAGQNMGVPILDHLIVSHGGFCSLRETTKLWQELPQGD